MTNRLSLINPLMILAAFACTATLVAAGCDDPKQPEELTEEEQAAGTPPYAQQGYEQSTRGDADTSSGSTGNDSRTRTERSGGR